MQSGPYLLNGFRVKVYRQDSATQWFTAIITEHNLFSRTMIVMTDQVLEPQNVDPAKVQMAFVDDVVPSLLKGESGGITSRRRSCAGQGASLVTSTTPGIHVSIHLVIRCLNDSDGSENEKSISKTSADTDPFGASARGPERQSVNVCSLNGRPVSLATTRSPPERRIALGGCEESSSSRPVAEVRPGGPAPIGTVTDSKSYRERDRIAVMETNEGRPFIWDFAPKLNSTAVSIGMPECWGQDYLLAPHSRSSLQLQRWPSPLHPRHEVENLVKAGFQPVAARHMLNETGRSLEKKDVFLPFSRDCDIDVKPLHFYPHPLPSGTHLPMHAQLGLSPTHLLAAQQSLAFSHAGLYPPATLLAPAPGHQPIGGPPPPNPALPPALDYRMSPASIMPQSRAVHASNLTALALAHQHTPQPQLPQPGSLLAPASHPMYSASSLGLYQHVLWPQQAGMRLPIHPGLAWPHPDAQIPDGKRIPVLYHCFISRREPERKSHGMLTPPKVEHNEHNAGAGLWLPHDSDLPRSCERHIKHEVDSPPTTATSSVGGFQLTSAAHPTHRSTYYTALSQSLDNEPSNRIPDERSHALTANSPLPLSKGQGTSVSKSLSKPPPLIRHTPDGSNVARDKPTVTGAGSSRKPPGPAMDSSSPLPPLLRPTVQPSSRERCESGSEPRPPTPLKVASPQQLLAAMMQPLELQPTLPLANGLQQPPGEPPPPPLCSAQNPQHRDDGRTSGRATSAQASVIVRPKSAVVPQPVPTGNVTLTHNPCHFGPSSNSEPIPLLKSSTGGSQATDSAVTSTEQNSRTSPTFPAPTPPPAINRNSPVCVSGAQYQSKKQKALQSATQGQSSTVSTAASNQTILMVSTALSNGNDSDSASVKSDVSSASSSRSPADVCLSGLPPNGPGALHTKLKKAWLTRHSEEDRSNYNRSVTAVTEAPLETTINTVTTSVVGPGTVSSSPPQLKVENNKREVERSADIRRGKRLREEIKQADGGECKRQKRVLKKDVEDQAKRKRSKDEGKVSVSGKTCESSAITKEMTETRRGKIKEKAKRGKKENAGSEMKVGERRGRADAREERRTKRAAKRALELGSESEEGSDECIEGRGSEARVKRQPKPTFKKKQIDLQRRRGNIQPTGTTTPQADEQRESEFPKLPESVLRDWRKVRRLKQSCQAFLQDGACASIAPSLQKCRECRLVRYRRAQDPHSAVFCRFYHFRRLSFNKNGALRIDGFSGSPGSSSACSGRSPVEEMPKVAWKRAVRGVREMCDACEATLFNVHWVCPKCGFVVCPCCYAAHRDRRDKKETLQWMKCVKGQVHDYKNLIPTQIIPGTGKHHAAILPFFEITIGYHHYCHLYFFNDRNVIIDTVPGNFFSSKAQLLLREPSWFNFPGCSLAFFTDSQFELVLVPELYPIKYSGSANFGKSLFCSLGPLHSLFYLSFLHPSSQPVLISSSRDPATTRSLGVWGPEALCLDLGRQDVEVENCRTSASIPVSLKEFWDGFVNFESKCWLLVSISLNCSVIVTLNKLKEFFRSPSLFLSLCLFLSLIRFDSLLTALPLPEYTNPDGQMNLASHLPSFFVRPDLGPIMHCAYGMSCVCVFDAHGFCISLVVGPVVVVQALDEAGVDKETQTLLRQSSCPPAAVWHVFSPEDADKIQSFLAQVVEDGGPAESDLLRSHSWFLDRNLRQRLADEQGVHAVPVVQSLGDVVLIPAGTPFQVQNLRSCVFVSQDFISHEHANRSVLTMMYAALQIYNIIYHAVKDGVGVLKSVGSQSRHCHTDGMKLSP
uniref:Lysine-specific demethylase n=1 Tax=Eptatretus burgeri TaxID=7764 RepID=A0A8C4NGK6_EPTBU